MEEKQKAREKAAGKARRRADRARIKKKCDHYGRSAWGRTLSPKELGRLVNTLTPCSCWMCGNPRRRQPKDRLTIWEKRWFQNVE
jgi:hypothetical protein